MTATWGLMSARRFEFKVCVLWKEVGNVLKKRKETKIRFGRRRKMMFYLFNKHLLSTYYMPGTVPG